MKTYRDLLDDLYQLNVQKHLGFKHMQEALGRLGNPEKDFKAIHIAGTNGKGSVSVKIAEALMIEGFQVGLTTSPHIGTYRERIQVNGTNISEKEVEELLPKVFAAGKGCTFFELTTLLAFLYFSKKKIQFAVVEVGVGGRFDATNILSPILTAITSVSLDHTAWLGETKEAIALEKAGIFKEGVPIVIGRDVPSNVEYVVNAPLFRVEGEWETYDEENSAVARKCLELLGCSEKSIAKGIKRRPPCRMEIVDYKGFPVVFDVAHNTGGFEAFFRSIGWDRFRVILGMAKDKDHQSCLEFLIPHAEEIFLTKPEGLKEGVEIATMEKILLDLGHRAIHASTVKDAVTQAIRKSSVDGLPVLVIGTFYIMAEAKRLFGFSVEHD